MPLETPDKEWIIFVCVMLLVILIPVLINFVRFLIDFSGELKYLKSEIERSSGHERKYWKKKRRKLWLSLLPFVKYK